MASSLSDSISISGTRMADGMGDLRSEAKDTQRVRNHNHKWSRGGAPASGRRCCPHIEGGLYACTDCWDKPVHPLKQRPYTNPCSKGITSSRKASRRAISKPRAVAEFTAAELEVGLANQDARIREESPPSSDSDVDIMYSFDAPTGPRSGEGVLNFAVDQAVERFENEEFEKIIKDFEIVDDEVESTRDDDEGFELIN